MSLPPQNCQRRRLLLASGALLGVAACGGDDDDDALSPSTVSAVMPALDRYAAEVLARSHVPGMAVGVVADGQVVWARGYGVGRMGGPAVSANTVFPLASLSKSVTSSAVAVLVGEGRIGWDDPVVRVDSNIAFYERYDGGAMSYRDLLSQRSGLGNHFGDTLEFMFRYERDEIVRRFRELPPVGAFRGSYAYSNWNLTMAGEAAAKAVGLSWERLVTERLFAPLGMTRSYATHAGYLNASDHVLAYRIREGKPVETPILSRDQQSPGGGLFTSLNDMLRWMRFQLNRGTLDGRRVAASRALQDTWERVNPTDPSGQNHYGLGWVVSDYHGERMVQHSGAYAEGINTQVTLLTDSGLGIVVLTNGELTGLTESVTLKLLGLVFNRTPDYDWWPEIHAARVPLSDPDPNELEDPAPQPGLPLPASAYTGVYTHPYFGEVEISAAGQQLSWRAGRDTPRVLAHWQQEADTDLFRLRDSASIDIVRQPVRFQMANGQATGLMLPLFDTEIAGAVLRRR